MWSGILGGIKELMPVTPEGTEIHATWARIENVLLEGPTSGIQQSTVDRSTTCCATVQTDKTL
jgi:hypothetical protein